MPEEQPPKTTDVTKTGASAAEPTARPIIVSNRPILKDPMVKNGQDKPEPSATGKTIPGPAGSVIKNEKLPAPQPEVNKPKEVKPEPAPASSEKAVMEAVAEKSANKGKTKDNTQITAEQARQAQVDKLVQEKTYFLPIGKVTKRKQNKQVLIVFAVVVVLVGVFFLLK